AEFPTRERQQVVLDFGEGATLPTPASRGGRSMCDYSLHGVATRPARVGDRLVSTSFPTASFTRGFAALEARDVAVCLAPGTEIAFDRDVETDIGFGFWTKQRIGRRLARFRQVNPDR